MFNSKKLQLFCVFFFVLFVTELLNGYSIEYFIFHANIYHGFPIHAKFEEKKINKNAFQKVNSFFFCCNHFDHREKMSTKWCKYNNRLMHWIDAYTSLQLLIFCFYLYDMDVLSMQNSTHKKQQKNRNTWWASYLWNCIIMDQLNIAAPIFIPFQIFVHGM